MPKIDITKFVRAVRPSNPEALTPADLQPFLLYWGNEAAATTPLVLEARGISLTDAQQQVVDGIYTELAYYMFRLSGYLSYVNAEVAEGNAGNAEASQPVVRPLFRGLFPESFKTDKTDGICEDPDRCYSTVPDIATLAIIRNQLTEFGYVVEEQQLQLLRDIAENTQEIGSNIASAGGGSPILDFYRKYMENYQSDAIAPVKVGLLGASLALGGIALYKLLK